MSGAARPGNDLLQTRQLLPAEKAAITTRLLQAIQAKIIGSALEQCGAQPQPQCRAYPRPVAEIGRESGRERACKYVSSSVVAVSLNKKAKKRPQKQRLTKKNN